VKNNSPLTLSIDAQKNYLVSLDEKHPENNGMMSIYRVRDTPQKVYITRRDRLNSDLHYVRAGHLVDIVGVYVEKDSGDIQSFLIQNSWGTKYGKNGFFRMDTSFFGGYVNAANAFVSDLNIPEIREILGADLVSNIMKTAADSSNLEFPSKN